MEKIIFAIQETADKEWCKCGKCGHKLFKKHMDTKLQSLSLEIKCSSCKSINTTGKLK